MDDREYYKIMKDAFGEEDTSGTALDQLPDSYLWKKPLTNMLTAAHYDHLRIPRYAGFLFSGPAGCGKHSTAEALIRSVAQSEEMTDSTFVLRLRADDFRLSGNEESQACVDGIFAAAGDTEGLRFIVFDQMERYKHVTAVMNRIADYLPAPGEQEGDDLFDGGRLFVICISEDDSRIVRELRRKLMCCRVTLPGEEQRTAFLKDQMEMVVDDWDFEDGIHLRTVSLDPEGIDTEELVRRTAGFSYQELTDFIISLRMEIAGNNMNTEPVTVIRPERALVLQYLASAHEESRTAVQPVSGGISAEELQAILASVPAGPKFVQERANDTVNSARAEDLLAKGSGRTLAENLELIDMVPTESAQ